jgi:hypothetical protein
MRTYLVSLVSLLGLAACEQSTDFGRPAKPTEAAPVARPVAASKPTPAPAPPSPAPTERRASGAGFTIALPEGWTAAPVSGDTLLFARSADAERFTVQPLVDGEVLRSKARCTSWAKNVADAFEGRVIRAELANGSCAAAAEGKGMVFYAYANQRASGMYASLCVGVAAMHQSLPATCAKIVASWKDDASAKPSVAQKRITIVRDNDRTTVRGSGIAATFPKGWSVEEASGDTLFQATSSKGSVVALAAMADIGALSADVCSELGAPLAQMLKGTNGTSRMIQTSVGEACRIDLAGAIFRWAMILQSPAKKTYMFGCVAGDECQAIVDTLRFE